MQMSFFFLRCGHLPPEVSFLKKRLASWLAGDFPPLTSQKDSSKACEVADGPWRVAVAIGSHASANGEEGRRLKM